MHKNNEGLLRQAQNYYEKYLRIVYRSDLLPTINNVRFQQELHPWSCKTKVAVPNCYYY